MRRRKRAVMAGIHRLQHIECLAASDFSDDDAVRTHAESILHKVSDRDRPLALYIRRTGLERHDMRLLKAELGGIFDGDDAFIGGDEGRKYIQRGRLTGAGTAADHDVQLRLDTGAQE